MLSAASDLPLLIEAARDAGALCRELMREPLDIQSKGEAGPVTNIDLAVNALLEQRLRGARADYGWLSEETPDEPARRIGKARAFMIDPIDGTAALIRKTPQFTISIGVSENGRAVAGAIYNPLTDEMFAGAIDAGATFNGKPAFASARDTLEGAHMVGQKSRFADSKWKMPWPRMDVLERLSIAYRLGAVACGQADATVLFGFKHEWDIAAGAAIVEAAGGRVSDLWGQALVFNQPDPRAPGAAASGAALHPLLIERTRAYPDPRVRIEAS